MDSLSIFQTILSFFSLPFPDYSVNSLMDTPFSLCLLPTFTVPEDSCLLL